MKRFGIAAGLLICIVAMGCTAPPRADTGFVSPFTGPERLEYLAPTKATHPSQLNVPIGLERANAIALQLGLRRDRVLSDEQFRQFISGGGIGGSKEGAALADRSAQILTNTNGHPLTSDVDGVPTKTVLASYGLFVDADGLLMSPANEIAPTRQVNVLLAPYAACSDKPLCGYINTWFLNNGAAESLVQLYQSGYTIEALYGNQSQQASGVWQLVSNTKDATNTKVGMSMAPSLWLTNFALLYTLNPSIAALMPAYWTPIPTPVADAILAADKTGFVQYSDYSSYFPS